MVRLESGERQLGALEAVAIADALNIRLTLLVYPPLESVASRRSDAAPSHHSTLILDEALEVFARDVANLAGDGVLAPGNSRRWPHLRSDDDAERMATQVREQVGLGAEAILDIGAVAEAFGMVTLSVPLGAEGADGAMVGVADGVAAAVINGDKRQGRRRWTVAHELGHWLTGDTYDSAAPDAERLINAFAAHLLAPRAGVAKLRTPAQSPREFAVAVAATFRLSWSATVRHLRDLNLITDPDHRALKESPAPTAGDVALAAGTEDYFDELRPPTVSPDLRRSILRGYRDHRVAEGLAMALLYLDSPDDLPTCRPLTDDEAIGDLGPRADGGPISVPGRFVKGPGIVWSAVAVD